MSDATHHGWRRRALEAASTWLALWRWPADPTGEGLHVLNRLQMRDTMEAAYLAGFEAGRQDATGPNPRERRTRRDAS